VKGVINGLGFLYICRIERSKKERVENMGKSLFSNSSNKMSRLFSFMLAFVIAFVPMTFNFPTKVEAATTLNVYPAPSGVALNTRFTVQVRVPGGTWQNLDEYDTMVGASHPSHASFVYFDSDGPVEMSVTDSGGNITSAAIRPLGNNITPVINGNTMTFTIDSPRKLSVEVNGDVNHNLAVFDNPVEVNPPSPTDPNVIYLGPGVYWQDYTVPSGKTLYLAGGAVIKGSINMDNTTNAKVMGRGVLDHPAGRAISADYTNQATIDGVIVNDYGNGGWGGCALDLGNATNATVNNFKAFSYKNWTDGIDTFAATNITINDYYGRTGDDSVAIYAARQNGGNIWSGNSSNIQVTNSILQPDLARPINVGTHGFPNAPGGGYTISDLSFSNIDVLLHNSLDAGKTSPIQFAVGDGNLVQDVNFTDIRIEDNSVGRIVQVATQVTDISAGRGINNVYFKNVTYTGNNSGASNINGYDSGRLTQNVTFENLVVNGNVVLNAAAGNFAINSYTRNINFIASGGSVPAPLHYAEPAPVNLAINKAASADSTQSGHPASSGNDNNTTTRWTANDGNTGHWWQVDLGSSMNITGGTQVMWELAGKAYKYKIETSNDNTNWTLQVDKTSNTDTNQVQSDVFYDVARYVRITVTGLDSGAWASLYDFKVLGDPTNLASGKSITADSTLSGFPAYNGNNDNAMDSWSAVDGNAGHWLNVDLGYVKNITYGTQVLWPTVGSAYQYKIETSLDNTNWTLQVDKTSNTNTDQVQSDTFTAAARYVRITLTGVPSGVNASISDFKVLGAPTDLALGETATADSSAAGNPASNGNDGDTSTSWSAADTNTGHWWTVDLGSAMNITNGSQVMWQQLGAAYKYKIETSLDNNNWNLQIDKTGNGKNDQVQSDYFTGTAQYVRITVTGMPSGAAASFYDFKVFGNSGDNVTMAKLPFDETSGTTALDTTGNGWNGTLVGGASHVAGKSGNAVDLSGSSQYVALPSGAVSNYDKITMAAWVNLDTASNFSRIFDFGSGTSKYMFLTPQNGANGKIRFAVTTNSYSGEQFIDGTSALPTGGWHHVAVTLNGSTGILYVDGVQVGSNSGMTIKPSDLGVTTQNWIGRSQYAGDPYLDGRVDDFRIYNRALTASEVTHVMNGQSALPAAELPFNETSGTTANDVSGNGWNGTLTGGATMVAGLKGNAVDVNGPSQYVALPTGVVSSADTITVAAWVNLDTVSNWARIFDFGSGTTKYMFVSPQNGANGNIRFEIKNGSTVKDIDGTAPIATGGWHHVAITLDGSTGMLYVDGQKVGSGAVNIRPSQLGATTQNWIGRSQFSADPYLDGRVDDFRIYNRALSAAEVSSVMNE
jgi:hypothetical protein